ncbi:tRNA (adenosine(37)-N6)-threonylcarbamoyltransferase complex transferase subunit TsaD [Xylocopilactobacillus apicola]|uniref:tRNA N6-adenosine threonylcarbamoyltransferase n=1 Tax=Xylocopilactobacillus apicola TaxID=2932184 RepID=A0AAU9D8P8_9LACO|nr:tRNA (adenosine(37)-N6)-threonylcarbamoyltransferase complex transferase subunit TsaD [Xylocopilactobacillus apicola]BDR58766.1 tRNA N6-adenosine threonylcarbamoyltransferase [Xylocopilactobacillus apicola]
MVEDQQIILGIESSCDETSVGIVRNEHELLANVITSQIKSHQRFGGVVPEVASRHHLEYINYCIEEAIKQAKIKKSDLNGIACTYGPGLAGCLMVGLTAAKVMAADLNLPFYGVNHMAGHIYAAAIDHKIKFPALALLVSGGHTEFVYMKDELSFEIIGTTLDDAVGEAYDKIGRLIGFNYPAGKTIDEAAKKGTANYELPRPMMNRPDLNFSFSGLKTAVRDLVEKEKRHGTLEVNDLAASFQEAVVEVLISKTKKALNQISVRELIVGGGVAANSLLKSKLIELIQIDFPHCQLTIPPLRLCGDNGAMIAAFGSVLAKNQITSPLTLDSDPGLSFNFSLT